MKIHILGTAAAEGFPAMFCECDTCKIARAEGGRSIRARSQAVIDEGTQIYVHHFFAQRWRNARRICADCRQTRLRRNLRRHGNRNISIQKGGV